MHISTKSGNFCQNIVSFGLVVSHSYEIGTWKSYNTKGFKTGYHFIWMIAADIREMISNSKLLVTISIHLMDDAIHLEHILLSLEITNAIFLMNFAWVALGAYWVIMSIEVFCILLPLISWYSYQQYLYIFLYFKA